jgi:predicted anti-sigma-YlaC factor YlaD
MDCSDAKHLIHLDVGNDLRVEEELQLAEHMGRCGECRSYHAGMSDSMSALLVLRDETPVNSGRVAALPSVWPAISREIQRRRVVPARARKFNLQVAALSVCSLSLAVVTIVQSLSSMQGAMQQNELMPAQPVSQSIGIHPYQQSQVRQLPGVGPEYFLPDARPADTFLPQSF